jgi:hypothetical protein
VGRRDRTIFIRQKDCWKEAPEPNQSNLYSNESKWEEGQCYKTVLPDFSWCMMPKPEKCAK